MEELHELYDCQNDNHEAPTVCEGRIYSMRELIPDILGALLIFAMIYITFFILFI